jgi:hypothetical protein
LTVHSNRAAPQQHRNEKQEELLHLDYFHSFTRRVVVSKCRGLSGQPPSHSIAFGSH